VSDEERHAPLEEAASLHDAAAKELEQAAAHSRVAATHFRNGDVPRGAAHGWAAHGHVLAAQERLAEQARAHAQRSNPVA